MTLLRLLRWPGALTAAANAAAGFLLARGPNAVTGWAEAGAVVAGAALIYSGGVVLNDVADAERDRTLHPDRPIPSGAVERRRAGVFGATLLVLGVLLVLLLGGLHAGLAAVAAAACALIYDVGGKRSRVPGAVLMAGARGFNSLAGMLASAGDWNALQRAAESLAIPTFVIWYPLAVATYTLTLTVASTFEERRLGKAGAGALAVGIAVVAAVPWAFFTARWTWGPAIPLLILGGSLIVGARDAAKPGGPGVGMLVRQAVFGFLLVDAAWLFGRSWYDYGFGLVLLYVAMRFALARARS